MNRLLADADVVLDRVIELRCARLPRFVGIDDGRQWFVVDLDRRGRVVQPAPCSRRPPRRQVRRCSELCSAPVARSRERGSWTLLRCPRSAALDALRSLVVLDRVFVGQHGFEVTAPSPRRRRPASSRAAAVSMPLIRGMGIAGCARSPGATMPGSEISST